jgi:Mg/Co/Ni transporter MgtE
MTCSTDAHGGLITTHGLRLRDDVPVQSATNGLAKDRDLFETRIEVIVVHPASDPRSVLTARRSKKESG